MVCIFFFFCCLLPKYKNFVTHYWYSYLGWNFCLQRCHCMTTDLCSSFETDMLRPLPPWPRPAQAHKCLKNTRLSAGASVKTVLSTPLTKPGSRKEKAEREKALFSVQQQLEDTRQTRKKRKKKDYRNVWWAKELPFVVHHMFFLVLFSLKWGCIVQRPIQTVKDWGLGWLSDTGVRPTTLCRD